MLESDPELESSLQKYVMESISKQVFSSFNLLFERGGVRDLGQLERSRNPIASNLFR